MPRSTGPTAPLPRSAGLAALAMLTALAGCVDVPVRLDPAADAGGEPSEAGAPDAAAPDGPPPDADPPDTERPDAAGPPPDGDVFGGDGEVDHTPDVGPCARRCPSPAQIAAHPPLDRLYAVRPLGDGTALLGGWSADLAPLAERIGAPVVEVPLVRDDPEAEPVEAGVPVLLHVADDLSTVLAVYHLPAGSTGPITDIQLGGGGGGPTIYLSTREGRATTYTAGQGYRVLRFAAPPSVDGAAFDRSWVVTAGGAYRLSPPWVAGADATLFAVDAEPNSSTGSVALWFGPDGAARIIDAWRHHVGNLGLTRYGGPPLGAQRSFFPLENSVRCGLRTWFATADAGRFDEPVPDGNGGERIGPWPFDAFTAGPCVLLGSDLEPTTPGEHGWRMVPGRSVDVSGVERGADGALFLAFDSAAERPESGDTDTVPTVLALGPDGARRWWRRPHPEGSAMSPVFAPTASPVPQDLTALAYDPGGGGTAPSVVVVARTTVALDASLWPGTISGAPQPFQQPPLQPNANPVGWIGRLDAATGDLRAATHVFGQTVNFSPEHGRAGRLACFVDTDRVSGFVQPTRPDRGGLAVGPAGEVAISGVAAGLGMTPDAWQVTGAPEVADALVPFVRIYDRDLSTVLYSSAVGPGLDPADPRAIGRDLEITDLAFTADGALLVVGHQTGEGRLAAVGVPAWADAEWPEAQRGEGATRAVVLRLVPDPACGR